MVLEFEICDDCEKTMRTYIDAASAFGGEVPAAVMKDLCDPCRENALVALRGGPIWN